MTVHRDLLSSSLIAESANVVVDFEEVRELLLFRLGNDIKLVLQG